YFNLFFNHTTTIEIYTLSLHDALPICLLIRGNYTWSKALGAYSDDQTFARIDRNDHFFYAPQNFDRRHNLSVNWVYELPKPTRNKYLGYIANNWQLSGVYHYQSGAPYSIGFSVSGYGNQN